MLADLSPVPSQLTSWAAISENGLYRYSLGRRWNSALPLVLFVGLNPSTADAANDDQTCKKWRGFAERWGFGGYVAGNLFGLRARDPQELVRRIKLGLRLEVVGDRNDPHLELLANLPDVTLIVPCWGSSIPSELRYRCDDVIEMLRRNARGVPLKCLGVTKGGCPKHPLMLGYDTPLVAFGGANLETLADEHIRQALVLHNGCIAKAAKALGIGRSTLYRWQAGKRSGAPKRRTLSIQERSQVRLDALLAAREAWRGCQNVGAYTRWLEEQLAELGGERG